MSRSQTRPPAGDAATLTGLPEEDLAIVIALCATVLDRLLEALLEMDPERGKMVHATVLRGLSTPGRSKPSVQ